MREKTPNLATPAERPHGLSRKVHQFSGKDRPIWQRLPERSREADKTKTVILNKV